MTFGWAGSPPNAASAPVIKRAHWGAPGPGKNRDVTRDIRCQNGFPCDVEARVANFGDPAPGQGKKLTVVWSCWSGTQVLARIADENSKVRVECTDSPPVSSRRIAITNAKWIGGPQPGEIRDVTADVRELCGGRAVLCQVPAMEYFFGDPKPGHTKTLSIAYTCSGQGTLSESVSENIPAKLDC